MKQVHLDAKTREAQILAASLTLCERVGYTRATLQQIADEAGVAKALPLVYFGTMAAWRRKVMREAVRVGNLPVIAQGLAARDPHARKASPEVQAAAVATLLTR